MALNVERLREAIEKLKKPEVVLGASLYFDWSGDTGPVPCCAMGHMVAFVDGSTNPLTIPKTLQDQYGFGIEHHEAIRDLNDDTPSSQRKAKVIEYLEGLIASETVPAPSQQ